MEKLKALKLIPKGIKVLNSDDFLERTLEITLLKKRSLLSFMMHSKQLLKPSQPRSLKQFEIAKKYEIAKNFVQLVRGIFS